MKKSKTPKLVRGYVKKDGTVVNPYIREVHSQPCNAERYDPSFDYQQQQFFLTQTLLNNTKDVFGKTLEISTRSMNQVLRNIQ